MSILNMLIKNSVEILFFLCRKIFSAAVALFVIVSLTFFLMKAIPGDPFQDEKALPKEIHEQLRKHYGLEDSFSKQYIRYLSSVVKFDFGPSLKYKGRSVTSIIREGFPVSFLLGVEAILIAVGMGISVGTFAAMNRNCRLDHGVMILIAIGISVPNFALATFLQYFFAVKWQLFPVARFESFFHTILPAISLAALPAAFIARLMRGQMIEVLRQDYIKTAKSKGLRDSEIIIKHVFRNALLPVTAYLGQLTGSILTGSFVVEKIFAIPGSGQWFVRSVMHRDYSVIMGLTVFYALIFMGSILFFDLVNFLLDPRLRENSAAKLSFRRSY